MESRKKNVYFTVVIVMAVLTPLALLVSFWDGLFVAWTPVEDFESEAHKGWKIIWAGVYVVIFPLLMLCFLIPLRRHMSIKVLFVINIVLLAITIWWVYQSWQSGMAYVIGLERWSIEYR